MFSISFAKFSLNCASGTSMSQTLFTSSVNEQYPQVLESFIVGNCVPSGDSQRKYGGNSCVVPRQMTASSWPKPAAICGVCAM